MKNIQGKLKSFYEKYPNGHLLTNLTPSGEGATGYIIRVSVWPDYTVPAKCFSAHGIGPTVVIAENRALKRILQLLTI